MEAGCVPSAGNKRSSAASTLTRSSSKNAGSFIAAGEGLAEDGAVTTRSLVLDRTVQQRAFRQLCGAGFRHGPRLLPIAFGIRAKVPRLLQIISSHRREKVVGSPAAAPLLPGAQATSRNQASLAAQAFLQGSNSRDSALSPASPACGSTLNHISSSLSQSAQAKQSLCDPRLISSFSSLWIGNSPRRLQREGVFAFVRFRAVAESLKNRLALVPK